MPRGGSQPPTPSRWTRGSKRVRGEEHAKALVEFAYLVSFRGTETRMESPEDNSPSRPRCHHRELSSFGTGNVSMLGTPLTVAPAWL